MIDFRDIDPAAFLRHWLAPDAILVWAPALYHNEESRRAIRSELIRLAGECYKSTTGE